MDGQVGEWKDAKVGVWIAPYTNSRARPNFEKKMNATKVPLRQNHMFFHLPQVVQKLSNL